MRKVVLKCQLSNRDRFEEKLSDIDLDFSPIFWQHDRVYVPRGYRRGQNFPRLVMRTEMKAVDQPPVYWLILRRHIEDSGIDIVETTQVQDYAEVVNIILQLGFKPTGEVSRRRQALSMGEDTYIYLDQIDGIDATFAKIESTVSPEDSITEARSDLAKTFETLGETHFIDKSYVELLAA